MILLDMFIESTGIGGGSLPTNLTGPGTLVVPLWPAILR